MPNTSPLRYPGGKTRAISILETYRATYYPNRTILLSPFVGGGSFELAQAANGMKVYANDLFLPLITFWGVLQRDPRGLHATVEANLPVTKEEFLQMRQTILSYTDPLEMATAYFLVNRCSFSGSTFCGGFSSQAAEKRCNQPAADRLLAVDLRQITFSNQDAITFLREHPEAPDTVVYADPPYLVASYIYGQNGDLHEHFDHSGFANALRARSDWILSYNDHPTIRALYTGCRIFECSWSYGMNASKTSSELIILPPAQSQEGDVSDP